jgi:hypothetical protein
MTTRRFTSSTTRSTRSRRVSKHGFKLHDYVWVKREPRWIGQVLEVQGPADSDHCYVRPLHPHRKSAHWRGWDLELASPLDVIAEEARYDTRE